MSTLGACYRSTFGYAAVGCLLLWAAMPPLDWWPLAWFAPVWWVLLVRQRQLGTGAGTVVVPPNEEGTPRAPRRRRIGVALLLLAACALFAAWFAVNGLFLKVQYRGYWAAELIFWPAGLILLAWAAHLAKRRPYVVLWLVGFAFLLAALHWLRFPHWAAGLAWLMISGVFAFWLPLFVGLTRVAVHVLRVPVIIAAPVVWTGVELVRAHPMTGVTHGSLGYAQYPWVTLIQAADLAGVYGVSFVVMFVAACLARMIDGLWAVVRGPWSEDNGGGPITVQFLRCAARVLLQLWPLVPALAILKTALLYGEGRMSGEHTQPGPRIALIQGAVRPQANVDEKVRYQIFAEYYDLSWKAQRKSHSAAAEPAGAPGSPPSSTSLDLIVWPESMFTRNYRTWQDDAVWKQRQSDVSEQEFLAWRDEGRRTLANMVATLRVPLLVGLVRQHFLKPDEPHYYNSAVYVAPERELPGRYDGPTGPPPGCYDKNYVVMFAEYVPLAQYFPWLARLTPLSVGAEAAQQPAAFPVGRFRIAPNICYESVLSHVVRGEVNALKQQDEEPDVLVNLTNDGWFWGSSELDMHLIRGVFRAVECRKPFLICANSGMSASIDSDGRIEVRGRRCQSDTLLAEVRTDQRRSWYLAHGDWFAGICLAACIGLVFVAVLRRFVWIPLSRLHVARPL